MMEKLDLITFGRAAVDLNATEYNRPMEETMTFTKYVGGSPANIAIGTSKLGLNVGMIAKVSDDQHGNFVIDYMKKSGVDTSYIKKDTEGRKIGLTFTEIKSPEECSILMYRDNAADLYLSVSDFDDEYIKRADTILISGTSLSQSPSREAALHAVDVAKRNGVEVIFELDYRPYTWKSEQESAVYMTTVARMADIVIGTRDEFDVMENGEGNSDEETVKELFEHSPQLIVIKHGVKGSRAFTKDGEVIEGTIYETKVLKTFGAGDSFASGFIYALKNDKSIKEALQYGSAAASIVVSKHSSSDAMPTVADIENLMNSHVG
ncbi:5-dehydro-2-deoxygluconokinase [Fictibacillus phosphorivorans]|uniref:5-dehydro-2-deoxygluconokinase n=1 Tax=Fictibacillus phosphorivorans TaxID=1221500 RepID=UPI0020406D57|nr:5-dehydro-2-deoxygluconokinase [Fictibacillus phosphorivorans]MCM3717702.1 5-dehydro-2-deoxygluconokinase [Fictibacillus phosphorivorans]MCM3775602.1 5-dehydro-2-deoxygluconokinase [Fictibacillus phosphorivorans]